MICFRLFGSCRLPCLNSLSKREIIACFHFAFRTAWWKKADLIHDLCLLEILSPPTVVERWICGFRFKSLPKVWMAIKMPGRKFFSAESVFIISAAMAGILLVRYRLYQKNGQRRSSIVKVMCCHLVLGRVSNWVLIQTSVAFLPQEEQNFDLQEWGIFFL